MELIKININMDSSDRPTVMGALEVEQPGAVSSETAKRIARLVADIMSDPERAADFERWQAERRKKQTSDADGEK